jgi:ABC-type thiamin/hydroxymethylpyrimidine transport system permease subunit
MDVAPIKKWYASKIVWASLITILLGMIPLVADLLKIVLPQSLEIVTAILTFASGILTLVWRLFFTVQPIL